MQYSGKYSKNRMCIQSKQNGTVCFTVKASAPQEDAIPAYLFGNFFEHLSHATQGGILAQILNNPAMTMDDNLTISIRKNLVRNGRVLEQIARLGKEKAASIYDEWTPQAGATGFSKAVMDDFRDEGLPFPWKATPMLYASGGAKGRVGNAVRLSPCDCEVILSQGVFLPQHRTLNYEGFIWVSAEKPTNICFRFAKRNGAVLTETIQSLRANKWEKLEFSLTLPDNSVNIGEPVDFQITVNGNGVIYIDRACLYPSDHIEGFDPEFLVRTKYFAPPVLRGPGGNFVSGYHFVHGIGDTDRRQTMINPAWPGIETNFFGALEFVRLCRLIGSEPHITINLGDGTPEEAAAWVEYVNGAPETYWGAKRAQDGYPQPLEVKIWELGNELYGEWQTGNCGDEEYALRYKETAQAMLKVDPTIKLIANGTEFDFYNVGMHWNKTLLDECGETLSCIALHALPGNENYPRHFRTADEMWLALQAQPYRWESVDLPNLFDDADSIHPGKGIQAAITEWGILGREAFLPSINNSGGGVFAAGFYNACIRIKERIFETNATALYHGGCINKAGNFIYEDPQMEVIRRYTELGGGAVYPVTYAGPVYQVEQGCTAMPPTRDVPVIDMIFVKRADGRFTIALVNRDPVREYSTQITLEDFEKIYLVTCEIQQGKGMDDINTPLVPDRLAFRNHEARMEADTLYFNAPPRSVIFITMEHE